MYRKRSLQENLFCISTNLRAGRTRPLSLNLLFPLLLSVSLARKFQPPRTLFYDIDEKTLSLSLFFFLCCLRTANRRPRRNIIPLAPVCFSQWESLHLSPSRIDEFIACTARSIVTKIVYDIDSSFYVNPVSERFWLTHFAHTNERNTRRVYTLRTMRARFCMLPTARKFVCANFCASPHGGFAGGRAYVSTNLRGNGRSLKLTSRYVAAMLIGTISIGSIGKRIVELPRRGDVRY